MGLNMLCCLVKKCGAGTSVSHCLNVLFFYFSCMGSHGKQRNQRKRGPQKLTYSEDVLVLNSTELQFLFESMTCICIHLLMRATEKYLSTSQCCQKYEGWRTNWRSGNRLRIETSMSEESMRVQQFAALVHEKECGML